MEAIKREFSYRAGIIEWLSYCVPRFRLFRFRSVFWWRCLQNDKSTSQYMCRICQATAYYNFRTFNTWYMHLNIHTRMCIGTPSTITTHSLYHSPIKYKILNVIIIKWKRRQPKKKESQANVSENFNGKHCRQPGIKANVWEEYNIFVSHASVQRGNRFVVANPAVQKNTSMTESERASTTHTAHTHNPDPKKVNRRQNILYNHFRTEKRHIWYVMPCGRARGVLVVCGVRIAVHSVYAEDLFVVNFWNIGAKDVPLYSI